MERAPGPEQARPSLARHPSRAPVRTASITATQRPCQPSQAPSRASGAWRRPSPKPAGRSNRSARALSPSKGQQPAWQPGEMVGQQLAGPSRATGSARAKGGDGPDQHQAPAAEGFGQPEDGRESIQGQGSNQLTSKASRRPAASRSRRGCHRAWPGEQHGDPKAGAEQLDRGK